MIEKLIYGPQENGAEASNKDKTWDNEVIILVIDHINMYKGLYIIPGSHFIK